MTTAGHAATRMMGTWCIVIATRPAVREAPGHATPLAAPSTKAVQAIPRIPDDLQLSPAETLVYAQDLLDRGLAFNAHEVLEAAWKNGPAEERALWQGLAQLMVGITHVQRGNVKGAITVLRRAAAGLAEEATAAPHAVDAAGLVEYADGLIDDLDSEATITATNLRPRLVILPR